MGKRIIEVPLDGEQLELVEVDDEDSYGGGSALAPSVVRCHRGGVGYRGTPAAAMTAPSRRRPPNKAEVE
jgi:hypothetical protein